ncbi:MAG: FkbM family methyltransferase [Dehalococcoidales bacterium]|jgi:FkbM family methyltransferase
MDKRLLYFGGKINSLLQRYGFGIRLTRASAGTMTGGIKRCRERGIEINTVIDIGASDGRWSETFIRYFPDAYYFLVEAQQPHEKGLAGFRRRHPNSEYIIAAAGNHYGEIYFEAEDLFGGVASEKPAAGKNIVVPSVTIDGEIIKRKLQPPFAIKMDTHGYELPILEGCEESLKNTNLLIIEAYVFNLTGSTPRFYELCSYLDKKGFYPVDIADLTWREYDSSLWQMDIFFIRKDRKEFTYHSFR